MWLPSFNIVYIFEDFIVYSKLVVLLYSKFEWKVTMFKKVILCSVLLHLLPLTQSQAIFGDSCRPQSSVDNDVILHEALMQLQMEFETYRAYTKHELQELNNRLRGAESELREIKSRADETGSMLNETEKHIKFSNGQLCLFDIIYVFILLLYRYCAVI